MDHEPDALLDETERSDETVGTVFLWSLAVIGLGLLAAGTWYFWPRPQPVEAVHDKDTAAIRDLAGTTETLPAIAFRDVAAEAGVDFIHFSGARGQRLLPETLGGGVALFDHDNNGTLDLLFVSGTSWPGDPLPESPSSSLRLYSNDGGAKFTEVTAAAGLEVQLPGMGCAVGDYDNDGWLDLYVTAVGGNRLYRNIAGVFSDVTGAAGLAGSLDAWSTAAGFFDFDRDGHLDLLVGNYVRWSPEIDLALNFTLNGVDRAYGPPTHYQGQHPFLFRGKGDGTFEDVARMAGLQVSNPDRDVPVAKTLGMLLVDINLDGWDDIVLANDTVRNLYFVNRQDGTFAEQGVLAGLAYDRSGRATGAMGIDHGHIWNDAAQAIAIGNFANEMSSVYVSQPTGGFVDEAAPLGIGAPTRQRLTFGTLWEDFDLDGRLDLLQVNGHLEDTISEVQPSQSYRQPAQLFWNKGQVSGTCFAELPAANVGDLARPVVGRGAATGDLDQDGDPDLVITQIDGPPMVLINGQSSGNFSVEVRLTGSGPNRFGLGSRIELVLGEGMVLTRHLSPTRGYLAQSAITARFGLGKGASWPVEIRVFSGLAKPIRASLEGPGTVQTAEMSISAWPTAPGQE